VNYTQVSMSELQKRRGHYVRAAASGERFVIVRSGDEVAALVSEEDLNRLRRSGRGARAPIPVTLTLFRAELPRLAEAAAARGHRYAVTASYGDHDERAALVSLEDLERLAQPDSNDGSETKVTSSIDERYRRALKEAGIEVSWPSDEPRDFRVEPIEYDPHGEWLSEQIVRERG
jgi:prevent-host-death family protein